MLVAQSGAYMSHLGDVDVGTSIHSLWDTLHLVIIAVPNYNFSSFAGCDLDFSLTTCCCAGFGLCRQKISGTTESIAFLAAGGTLVYRHLEADETITVDSGSVVAIEEGVGLGIIPNGQLCTCCFGGEGCFSTTLTGPGKVFLQVRTPLVAAFFRGGATSTFFQCNF